MRWMQGVAVAAALTASGAVKAQDIGNIGRQLLEQVAPSGQNRDSDAYQRGRDDANREQRGSRDGDYRRGEGDRRRQDEARRRDDDARRRDDEARRRDRDNGRRSQEGRRQDYDRSGSEQLRRQQENERLGSEGRPNSPFNRPNWQDR